MDPVTTLISLLEAINEDGWDEALDHANNLEEWLRKKGYYPQLESLSRWQQCLVVDCLITTVQKVAEDGPERMGS